MKNNVIKPGSYKIKLMSDYELSTLSEINFSEKDLISKTHCLDSALFGAVDISCAICRKNKCAGHMGLITLPVPLPRILATNHLKTLVKCLCPKCGKIVLKNEIKEEIMKLPSSLRLHQIKEEVDKINDEIICPNCKQKTSLISVEGNDPIFKFILNKTVQLNPIAIHILLSMFDEIDLVGLNDDWHPKNFFTIYIPIIPNKLRLKLFDSTTSVISSYYKSIIEEIIPELTKIIKSIPNKDWLIVPNNGLGDKFNKLYDQLSAYYYLITDSTTENTKDISLQLINKKDRKHVDPSNSLLGRLKGKQKKLFAKGIIDSRHDCSARTVLGGAPDTSCTDVSVPKYITKRLTKSYPVYEENLKIMKQLVAAMSNPKIINDNEIPRIFKVHHTKFNFIHKIEQSNAIADAALLIPGDKVEISLFDGDFVMQNRYPSVREESWSSLKVTKDDNSIISIPLAICEMKMADFDGDEAQIFVSSNNNFAIEQLLLHSIYKQCIAYKDGNPAIFYSKDSAEGVTRIKQGKKTIIKNWDLVYPLVNCFTEIESVFPKHLNYASDKLVIKNSKIQDKSNFNDKEFYKYLSILYGNKYVIDVIDKVSQVAYDLNKNDGITLGFNIRVFDKNIRKEIQVKKDKLLEELYQEEKSNDPDRGIKQIIAIQKIQPEIKEKLKKDISASSEMGSYMNRLEELYTMLVSVGQITEETGRIPMVLAEGSRVNCAYPRYSIDPAAYGYISRGYLDDPGPVEQLYNARAERKQLYAKGASVGTQGYMQKRLCMYFGSVFAGYCGELCDNRRIISLQYGSNGTDPRMHIKIPIIFADITNKKYSNDIELKTIHGKIMEWRNRFALNTHETASNQISNYWTSGFNWDHFIKTNSHKIDKIDKDNDLMINRLCEEIKDIFVPKNIRKGFLSDDDISLINLYYHLYYFRIIFREYELTENVYRKIIEIFRRILVNSGDPVGMKAAIAASEPLTQATLHAIHSHAAGVSLNKLVRTDGSARFEELRGGAVFTNTVITLVLKDDSKENSIRYAEKLETFYLADILVDISINITNGIDNIMKEEYKDIPFDDIVASEYYIQMTWDLTEIANYMIHPVDVINELMKKYQQIMFIGGYILNASEIRVHVYFNPDISLNNIFSLTEEWNVKNKNTVIHGEYLINCYVSENISNPGHYIIEGNEIENTFVLENIIYDPELNPVLCRSTNINTMIKLFGICESTAQLAAELQYAAQHLSATSGVLQEHYLLMSQVLTATGKLTAASRYAIRNDEYNDSLKKINFEDVKKGLIDSVITNKPEPCGDGYVSSHFFGEIPPSGDGVSKIILYEQ